MIYRIVIQSSFGHIYYLTSVDNPKTDDIVDKKNIDFLSNLNSTHAHTFSTKELAQEAINSLPYPYNEKAIYLETESINSPIVEKLYYRIIKSIGDKSKIYWVNNDKTFDTNITNNSSTFHSLKSAEEFQKKLFKTDLITSKIVLVYDYGLPNYDFDIKILKTNKIIKFRKEK
jgi:hypothetical protein